MRPSRVVLTHAAFALLCATVVTASTGAVSSPAATSPAAKRPRPLPMTDECVRGALRQRIVRFSAADGVRLIGIRLGSGPRGVLLAHMSGQDLCAWLPDARRLAAGGYNVLAFDLREHGSSATPAAARKWGRYDLDVRAAAVALRRRGAQTVVAAGGSLGAIAVVAAAPGARSIDATVSLSAPLSYGTLYGERAAARILSPVLYAAAEGDAGFAEDARRLHAVTPAIDKRLLIVAGTAHGIGLLHVAQSHPVAVAFDEFLREHSAVG